ncbi:MAG: alpha-glucan family phosphorylase [Rhodothermales bacterium]
MTPQDQLNELSKNLWWSWNPDALTLFTRLNRHAFQSSRNNPLMALKYAKRDALEDPYVIEQIDSVYRKFRRYMDEPGGQEAGPRVSYFCMEYGLHESMPLYSGGLGILAGDHVKAASDVGLPFTAVGLFIREGYFRQYFDEQGRQHDDYPAIDVTNHAVELVTDENGRAIVVTVHSGDEPIHLRAFRLQVGKSTLYLLDSDFSENPYWIRFLTRRLYQGDRITRLQQEIILGIGGLRMLKALGVETDVYHMNEGHCAFLSLELLNDALASGMNLERASKHVREQCVFTTHTPVPAGHDRFAPEQFNWAMSTMRRELGMDERTMLSFGRVNADDDAEEFTMTILGLKLARAANGVSKLNGEVARRQWHHLYSDRSVDEVPISHITNGIHLPTWASPASRTFLRVNLGSWTNDREKQSTWDRIDEVSDANLWEYRRKLRQNLIDFVNRQVQHQTLPQKSLLNPRALTIGFARRFATYKRAPLLFSDVDRVADLFSKYERNIQVIYAGKAHPKDEGGQAFIQQIYELSQRAEFKGRLIFLENYNMEIGRMLVSGCDVWLNNPRRPYEASGTSGQKIALHGGLNLSILDGWWPEGYDGSNGWAIGHEASHEIKDPEIQDAEDAEFLYRTLENEVLPLFNKRGEDGLPKEWISMIRSSIRSLTYQFSAHRMILDYVNDMYREPVGEVV